MLQQPAPIEDLIYISAIMLAAGRSDRMGDRNKLLLPWGRETMLEASLAPYCALPFSEVVVVTGYDHDRIEDVLAGWPVRLIRNGDFEEGLATSIRAGVDAAFPTLSGTTGDLQTSSDSGGYLLALGDMPMIRVETLRRVCDAFLLQPPPSIARPAYRGRGGHPVLFSHSFRADLLSLEGDAGARSILRKHRKALLDVQVDDPGVVADLDTPQAYEAARERGAAER